MSSVVAVLLFVLAIAIGWVLGRRSLRSGAPGAPAEQSLQERVRSIHSLLDRHSDDALEHLSQGLALNVDTLESHVHVGNLFRRRGDIEKAIQIHQELLSRVPEGDGLAARISLELARDFIAGGLLGHAEQLLDELLQRDEPAASVEALDELRRIAEREKNWSRAIELASRLLPQRPQLKTGLANYFCELAQEKTRLGEQSATHELLREALRIDRNCVRALLMRLDCELWRGDLAAAISSMRELLVEHQGFAGELLPILRRHNSFATPEVLAGLRALADEQEVPSSVLAMLAENDADTMRWRERMQARLQQQPSWQGLMDFVAALGADKDDVESFSRTRPLLLGLYGAMPHYRCGNCGFAGREMHWQCPGCHAWNSIMPIQAPLLS